VKVSKEEYKTMSDKASPGSPYVKDIIMAFLVGGLICATGQLLANLYVSMGLELKDARSWVSITLIALSALLTAFGVFDNIAKFAGAGTLVPITGFANSIVAPAIEFKSEGRIMGVGAKMFIIAGPVLVYGITASVLYGFILCIFRLY